MGQVNTRLMTNKIHLLCIAQDFYIPMYSVRLIPFPPPVLCYWFHFYNITFATLQLGSATFEVQIVNY